MTANITDWIAYAAARGDTIVDDTESAAALVRAMDHIKYRWLANLQPRYSADTLDVVEPATYEAAKIELATPGFFSKTYTAAEQKTLTEVKGIKWTVTGETSGTYAAMPTSTTIKAMFEPYIIDRDADSFAFMAIGGRK